MNRKREAGFWCSSHLLLSRMPCLKRECSIVSRTATNSLRTDLTHRIRYASFKRQATLARLVLRDSVGIHRFLCSSSPIQKELIRRGRSDPQAKTDFVAAATTRTQLPKRKCTARSSNDRRQHRPAKPTDEPGRVAARYESTRSVPPRSRLSPHLYCWKPAALRIRALLPSSVLRPHLLAHCSCVSGTEETLRQSAI
jgi:hypothetical protein